LREREREKGEGGIKDSSSSSSRSYIVRGLEKEERGGGVYTMPLNQLVIEKRQEK
jgi:hypothetical protein